MLLISHITLRGKVVIGRTLVKIGKRGQFIKTRSKRDALGIVTGRTEGGKYVITYL